jgi:hypothetical protein
MARFDWGLHDRLSVAGKNRSYFVHSEYSPSPSSSETASSCGFSFSMEPVFQTALRG